MQDMNNNDKKPNICMFYQNFQVPRKNKTDGIRLQKRFWKATSFPSIYLITQNCSANCPGKNRSDVLHKSGNSASLCADSSLLSALPLRTSHNETGEFQAS